MTYSCYDLPQVFHQRVTGRAGLDVDIEALHLSFSQLTVYVTGEIHLNLFVLHFEYVAGEQNPVSVRG